jgi:hypothetical protein
MANETVVTTAFMAASAADSSVTASSILTTVAVSVAAIAPINSRAFRPHFQRGSLIKRQLVLDDFRIQRNNRTDTLKFPPSLGILARFAAQMGELRFACIDGGLRVGFRSKNRRAACVQFAKLQFKRFQFRNGLGAIINRFPGLCCALACELGRVRRTSNFRSVRGSGRALGPLCVNFEAVRCIIPSIRFLFKLTPISREIFHQLKHRLALGLKLGRLSLAIGKPIHRFLELSPWPFRATERVKSFPNGLWNFLSARSTCYETDLCLKTSLHRTLALIIKCDIAEGLPLLNPKRSPDARLTSAPAAGEAKQALKLGLGSVILE